MHRHLRASRNAPRHRRCCAAVNAVVVATRSAGDRPWSSRPATNSVPNCSRPGALGRRLLQIRRIHQLGEQLLVDRTGRRHAAVAVVAHRAARKLRDQRVDQHVAWAGIKGDDLLGGGVRRDGRDVGDAADVQRDAAQRADPDRASNRRRAPAARPARRRPCRPDENPPPPECRCARRSPPARQAAACWRWLVRRTRSPPPGDRSSGRASRSGRGSAAGPRDRRQASSTASANSSPSRKFNWLIFAVCVSAFETDSTARRTAEGYSIVWCASGRTRCSNPAPRISTMATSMPSTEVPLIKPATSMNVHSTWSPVGDGWGGRGEGHVVSRLATHTNRRMPTECIPHPRQQLQAKPEPRAGARGPPARA